MWCRRIIERKFLSLVKDILCCLLSTPPDLRLCFGVSLLDHGDRRIGVDQCMDGEGYGFLLTSERDNHRVSHPDTGDRLLTVARWLWGG